MQPGDKNDNELFGEDELPPRTAEQSDRLAKNILSKAKSAQSRSDIAEFGLVKIWSAVVEMLNVLTKIGPDKVDSSVNPSMKKKGGPGEL